MNSQTLGGLASSQKIDNVFRVFGYSIPIEKDGRRKWPTKFKREMAKQMMSGKLTVGDVQKTCWLSDSGACYISGELADLLEDKGMPHTRGAP